MTPAAPLVTRSDRSRWLASATASPFIAFLAAAMFAVVRWVNADQLDISRSVVIGKSMAPGSVRDAFVFPGSGYDGQFYYRMAISPFRLDGLVNGIAIDSPLHSQRITYSVLIWVLTGGTPSQVPLMMVAVNVVLFTLVAWLGALIAQSYQRSPWWGLAFCCFGGFVVTLSRDLTELTSSALLLAAILSLRRERYFYAAALLSAGVLARESVGVLIAAMAIGRIVGLARRQHGFGPIDLAWGAPTAVFVAWQALLAHEYHVIPILSSPGVTGLPGTAAVRAFADWMLHPQPLTFLALTGTCSLVLLLALLLPVLRDVSTLTLTALALALVLALSLSADVWNDDPAEFRTRVEIHLFGVLALLQVPGYRLGAYCFGAVVPLVLFGSYYATAI